MYSCASCAVLACKTGERDKLPKNCPMREEDNFGPRLREAYLEPETQKFYVNCSAIEAEGYCRWPRLREVAEFARVMGYTKLGMGFCAGLKKEAAVVESILRRQGFEVVSVICKTGGMAKSEVGIAPEQQIDPEAREVMCNPIAQARLLNKAGTQLNICLGLCVGHDSLFYRHCEAPVTTLVAKDRVTGNNPAAAIYCADSYFKNRNTIQD